jgi:hypothetical protein
MANYNDVDVLEFVRECYTPEYHQYITELAVAVHSLEADGSKTHAMMRRNRELALMVKSQRAKMIKVIRNRMTQLLADADEGETHRLEAINKKMKQPGCWLERLYFRFEDEVGNDMNPIVK